MAEKEYKRLGASYAVTREGEVRAPLTPLAFARIAADTILRSVKEDADGVEYVVSAGKLRRLANAIMEIN